MNKKTSFKELYRLFSNHILARELAEPLFSLDAGVDADHARTLMEKKGFDLAGIREDGEIIGFVLKDTLQSGNARTYLKYVDEAAMIDESDSMVEVFRQLELSPWIFVRFLGKPIGIITRADLQKAPSRMWLFGLISLLEMQMTKSIQVYQEVDDWWIDSLTEGRLEKAKVIYEDLCKRNEETSLLECTQLTDKFTIIGKSSHLLSATGFESEKKRWEKFGKKITELRDTLAHSAKLQTSSWGERLPLVAKLESVIQALENPSK